MRICSVNVEWMNDWFTPDDEPPAFRPQFRRDGQLNDTATTAGRLAAMLKAIDADVIAIQEGPSRAAELALFVDRVPRRRVRVLPRRQRRPAEARAALPERHVGGAHRRPRTWSPNGRPTSTATRSSTLYRFTRTPLVVDLVIGDQPLQLVVAHTKSNFINMGRELWENPATRQAFIVEALTNRRRISAEGMRIRRYLDAPPRRRRRTAPIIVLGDLNDGPGLDYFEERYLTHNVTDIVVGSAFRPEWQFTHAQHDVPAAQRYTAVFEDFIPTREVRRLLLDHILLSPGLEPHRVPGSGAIRHAEYDAQVVDGGVRRQDRPCDHRPVTVDLRTDRERGAALAREVRHAGRGLDVDQVGVDQRADGPAIDHRAAGEDAATVAVQIDAAARHSGERAELLMTQPGDGLMGRLQRSGVCASETRTQVRVRTCARTTRCGTPRADRGDRAARGSPASRS